MKCPFRKQIKVEFSDFGKGNIAMDSQKEEFMDCYENECACYKWDVNRRSYICKQVEALGLGDINE